ncbi:hypothetical protein B0O80DRAFT_444393 [Mortierella sp. GBAus27b]|nr:hypothetical protein BGX31_004579 [Mortierella sp. GBA43]KAI8358272.1 hypothetical protein B0O80DRAFT_444393 [Mortierella sp. GBAus27b]
MIVSTLSKASLALIAASILLLLCQSVESHSWIQCFDWKFKKPQKKGQEDWSASNGECRGYARRFPKDRDTVQYFNTLDNKGPVRHYQQKKTKNPDSCSNGHNGIESGGDETLAKPVEGAYFGSSGKNKNYGAMTVKKAGEQMCMRWPAKNHAVDRGEQHIVHVALSSRNPTKEPSQLEFNSQGSFKGTLDTRGKTSTLPYVGKTQRIAALDFQNCVKNKKSTDNWPCGGCIDLPKNLQPGYYAIQWRWMLKGDHGDEWYTSCGDIKIVGSSNSTSTKKSSTKKH